MFNLNCSSNYKCKYKMLKCWLKTILHFQEASSQASIQTVTTIPSWPITIIQLLCRSTLKSALFLIQLLSLTSLFSALKWTVTQNPTHKFSIFCHDIACSYYRLYETISIYCLPLVQSRESPLDNPISDIAGKNTGELEAVLVNSFFYSLQALQWTSTEGLQATCAAALELCNLNNVQGL